MKDGLNHGFDGLTDDTDVAKRAPSVQSHNPWRSVIETPSGYKQTEVGVIPENWEVKSLYWSKIRQLPYSGQTNRRQMRPQFACCLPRCEPPNGGVIRWWAGRENAQL